MAVAMVYIPSAVAAVGVVVAVAHGLFRCSDRIASSPPCGGASHEESGAA